MYLHSLGYCCSSGTLTSPNSPQNVGDLSLSNLHIVFLSWLLSASTKVHVQSRMLFKKEAFNLILIQKGSSCRCLSVLSSNVHRHIWASFGALVDIRRRYEVNFVKTPRKNLDTERPGHQAC